MTRKTKLDAEAEALAEAQAAKDAELLAALQARDAEPEPEPEPEPQRDPTLADRFLGMVNLVSSAQAELKKQRRPLSEGTLTKILETALQYHAWDFQRRQAEAQNPFAQFMSGAQEGGEASGGEGLLGPEPDEILSGIVEEDTDTTSEENNA